MPARLDLPMALQISQHMTNRKMPGAYLTTLTNLTAETRSGQTTFQVTAVVGTTTYYYRYQVVVDYCHGAQRTAWHETFRYMILR